MLANVCCVAVSTDVSFSVTSSSLSLIVSLILHSLLQYLGCILIVCGKCLLLKDLQILKLCHAGVLLILDLLQDLLENVEIEGYLEDLVQVYQVGG